MCYLIWLSLKTHAHRLSTTLYDARANLLLDYLRAELRQPTIRAYYT